MLKARDGRRRLPMGILDKFEQEVSSWAGVSVYPHRFGGREFRFGDAEVGHIHAGGILDIRFRTRSGMHCSTRALPRSTTGFPTQAGSAATSEVTTTSSTLFGSPAYPTCAMH